MPGSDEPREIDTVFDPASGAELRVMDAESVMESYERADAWLRRWLDDNGERLQEVATRHLPSDGKPDKMALSTTPSKGDSMARDWTQDPASEPQINYLNSVMQTSVSLQKALLAKGVDGTDELMSKMKDVVEAAEKRIADKTFTKGNASQALDFIIDMNRKLESRLKAFNDGSHTVLGRETGRVVEDGIYQDPFTGQIWKVQEARQGSGRLYAKRLEITSEAVRDEDGNVVTPAKGKFRYVQGGLRRIDQSWKMDLDAAKAFGALYGMCCACAADLTAEESIAAGIGPVCGKRFTSNPPEFTVPAEPTTQYELDLRAELGLDDPSHDSTPTALREDSAS